MTKKAKLKRGVDSLKLVVEFKELLEQGQIMLKQPVIEEDAYNSWYENVLTLLKTRFTSAENEYKFRFVGPPPLPSFSHDGKLSVEPDLQFELHRDLGNELDSLNYIISDILMLFCNK